MATVEREGVERDGAEREDRLRGVGRRALSPALFPSPSPTNASRSCACSALLKLITKTLCQEGKRTLEERPWGEVRGIGIGERA